MANDVMLSLCAMEGKQAALNAGVAIEDQLKAAMNATANHWMVLDEDTQFRGAIAGVLLVAEERGDTETQERLTHEVQLLRGLSALLAGVPVDAEQLVAKTEDGPKPLGLIKLWRHVKHGESDA